MRRALVLVLLLAPALVPADQVVLKGGRKIIGVVVDKTPRAVSVEVGPGRVTFPMSQVESIETGASALASYRSRAAAIAPGDASGWLELALWARDAGLETQAQDAFARVVAIDPTNALAHAGLGDVRLAGRWVSPEESYRAQGLVPLDGAWVTASEREAILRERAGATTRELARLEAEARAREAEARARAAEAEARRAELQPEGESSGGIPYGFVLAGGCGGRGCSHPFHPRTPAPRVPKAPAPAPAPAPQRDHGSQHN